MVTVYHNNPTKIIDVLDKYLVYMFKLGDDLYVIQRTSYEQDTYNLVCVSQSFTYKNSICTSDVPLDIHIKWLEDHEIKLYEFDSLLEGFLFFRKGGK